MTDDDNNDDVDEKVSLRSGRGRSRSSSSATFDDLLTVLGEFGLYQV